MTAHPLRRLFVLPPTICAPFARLHPCRWSTRQAGSGWHSNGTRRSPKSSSGNNPGCAASSAGGFPIRSTPRTSCRKSSTSWRRPTGLLMPIEHVDRLAVPRGAQSHHRPLPRRKPERLSEAAAVGRGSGAEPRQDLLPSPEAGPEAPLRARVLLDELELALDELPEEQRDVFVAHEWDGRSFKEIAAADRRQREHAALAEALRGASPARAASSASTTRSMKG